MCAGALSSERNGTMGAVQDQKGTIVVVDDEPNIADLVDLYLAREGFRVLKTDTGEAGLPAIKDNRPRPASRSWMAYGATTGTATRAPSTCTSRRCARSSATPSTSRPCAESVPGWSRDHELGAAGVEAARTPPRHPPVRRDARDRVRRARPQRSRHGRAVPADLHGLGAPRSAGEGTDGEQLGPAPLGVPLAQPDRGPVGRGPPARPEPPGHRCQHAACRPPDVRTGETDRRDPGGHLH